MMARTVRARVASVYRLDDGELTGQTLHATPGAMQANLPAGCGLVDGEHDHRNRRVDLTTGSVVAYQPPQPAATEYETYVWDVDAELWLAQPTAAAQWRDVRRERDRLLAKTDWVVLRAADRGEAVPADWLEYRQALRDITLQPDPTSIDWPLPPSA